MKSYTWILRIVVAGIAVGSMYQAWRRRRHAGAGGPVLLPPLAPKLLTRAAPLLRLPTSPDLLPEVVADGSGLRCRRTGRIYPYRNGVLDLLDAEVALTRTQHTLNTWFTAWAYDCFRDIFMRLFGLPSFAVEAATMGRQLRLTGGDTILDLACGQGNFTVELAKRIGPKGLVIGLDLSPAMLARAVRRLRRQRLSNVVLIRGDALALPLVDGALAQINCSGGFHQLPNLRRALEELGRVSAPGALLSALTFAEGPDDRWRTLKRWLEQRFELHFVPLSTLGDLLAAVGYHDYCWSLPSDWFGYIAAEKARA